MQCGSCRANFCWACMRVDAGCTHFGCAHNAPHGNASPWDPEFAATGDAWVRHGQYSAALAAAGAVAAAVAALCYALALVLRLLPGLGWMRAVGRVLGWALALPSLPVLAVGDFLARHFVFTLAVIALLAIATVHVYRIARQGYNFAANQRHWEAEARAAERELR